MIYEEITPLSPYVYAVWIVDSRGSKDYYIRWGPDTDA